MPPPTNTFSKEERICGKTTVSALMRGGRWGTTEHFKYCWSAGGPKTHAEKPEMQTGRSEPQNAGAGPDFAESKSRVRILVSVPKKFFRRAVKRNLLKRRTRESYRCNKGILEGKVLDIMFIYSSPELADFNTIREEVTSILKKLAQ